MTASGFNRLLRFIATRRLHLVSHLHCSKPGFCRGATGFSACACNSCSKIAKIAPNTVGSAHGRHIMHICKEQFVPSQPLLPSNKNWVLPKCEEHRHEGVALLQSHRTPHEGEDLISLLHPESLEHRVRPDPVYRNDGGFWVQICDRLQNMSDAFAASLGSLFRGRCSGVVVQGSLFKGSLFRGRCSGVVVQGSLFKGSLFKGSLFKGSLFKGSLFKGSLFKGSLFKGSLFKGSLFKGSLFKGSLFKGSLFKGSLFKGSLFKGSLFKGSLSKGSLSKGSLFKGSLLRVVWGCPSPFTVAPSPSVCFGLLSPLCRLPPPLLQGTLLTFRLDRLLSTLLHLLSLRPLLVSWITTSLRILILAHLG